MTQLTNVTPVQEVKVQNYSKFFRGQDGFSPTIEVESVEKGFEVNVTDVHGQKSFTIPSGVTFTPSVDEEGNLSWTNNGDLPNPDAVNVSGPEGPEGKPGSSGVHVGPNEPDGSENVWVDLGGNPSGTETWTFTLENGETVSKTVVVIG